MRSNAVFAASVLCVLVTGCENASPNTIVAHKIADELPRVIGPAAQYDVTVDSDPLSLARGHASRVQIHGTDVQLAPGATVDTLFLDVHDVNYNLGTKHLEHIGPVGFVGTLGQEHLTTYLARIKSSVPGLAITLRDHDVEGKIPISAFSMTTTASLSGTLSPTAPGASTINFKANGAEIGQLPIPASLINQGLDEINPIIDLSTTKVPMKIDSLNVVNGKLVLQGRTDLGALVK